MGISGNDSWSLLLAYWVLRSAELVSRNSVIPADFWVVWCWQASMSVWHLWDYTGSIQISSLLPSRCLLFSCCISCFLHMIITECFVNEQEPRSSCIICYHIIIVIIRLVWHFSAHPLCLIIIKRLVHWSLHRKTWDFINIWRKYDEVVSSRSQHHNIKGFSWFSFVFSNHIKGI